MFNWNIYIVRKKNVRNALKFEGKFFVDWTLILLNVIAALYNLDCYLFFLFVNITCNLNSYNLPVGNFFMK